MGLREIFFIRRSGADAGFPPSEIYIPIFSVITLFMFPVLFLTRSMDDNSLTNWQWSFQHADAGHVMLTLTAGVVLAVLISGTRVAVRSPSVFLFAASFSAVVPLWQEPELIVDASRYFTQAKHLSSYGAGFFVREWGGQVSAWTDLPLVPFVYGLIFKSLGEGRLYVQVFTTSVFSLSAVLTYHIGRSFWDDETGFAAGALLLGMPYLLVQAPLMLVDVPAMFLFLLAVFTFIRALDRGGWMVPCCALAVFLAFLSKYSVWLMLSTLGVVYLSRIFGCIVGKQNGKSAGPDEKIRETVARYVILRGAVTALLAAVLAGAVFFYKHDLFSAQMKLLMEYQRPGLDRWKEGFISTFFFQINPLITLSAICSAYPALKERDINYTSAAWLVILVLLMGIRRIRYIIMALPMLCLMSAYAICRIRNKAAARHLIVCIIIFSLVIAYFAYLPFLRKNSFVNLKSAGRYLDSLHEENAEVFTIMPDDPAANPAVSVPMLDMFTKKNITYEYDPAAYRLPRVETERSSLRFTWEYRNPLYYTRTAPRDGDTAIVLISGRPDAVIPPDIADRLKGYSLDRAFSVSDGIFRFGTFVNIYRAENGN